MSGGNMNTSRPRPARGNQTLEERDVAPHLNPVQGKVAEGDLVHDQTPESGMEDGIRTPVVEQTTTLILGKVEAPRVRFENNRPIPRRGRSLSLDSLTQASAKEAIEALRETRRTVNAVHEDVVEWQKQLDTKIDAVMRATELQYSSQHEVTPQPSTSTGEGKAIDPCNWGSAQIPEEELDPETQRSLLQAAKNNQDTGHSNGTETLPPPNVRSQHTEESTEEVVEIKPRVRDQNES